MDVEPDELTAVRRERELFAQFLELRAPSDVDGLLADALLAAARQVGARRGYLAIYAQAPPAAGPPRWSRAYGCDDHDLRTIQEEVSRTIIDDTLQRRRVTLVPSAMGHPKYAQADSVQANRITSVVCAPVGSDGRGILYLQERRGGGVFLAEHEAFVVRLGQLIGPLVDRIIATHDEVDPSDPTVPWRRGGRFAGIVGRSEAMGRVFRLVFRAAQDDEPVLLVGPAGTGKTLLARALHDQGARAEGPFVHVACGSLEGDGRADLLGDAAGERAGLAEVAQGGTLYLHHVDALSVPAQRVLVELLEKRAVRFGDGTVARPDLRIVASARTRLDRLADQGKVIGELLARLQAGRIDVPGVGERGDDLELLLSTFGREQAARQHLPWHGLTTEALQAARAHEWTHHVRELVSLVAQAVLLVDGKRPIDADELFPTSDDLLDAAPPALPFEGPLLPWRDAKRAFEASYLAHALQEHDGNVTATARTLGVSRSRMFALLNERGLRDEEDDRAAG
ncbi:MAG: sigma-54-dependent Fis family transcriptional regulator [Alphaproteobacteria bacterium]|nr:sigma-54-dependent Fis family transcriptional regulator [Alphaproteobacteria bacterium]